MTGNTLKKQSEIHQLVYFFWLQRIKSLLETFRSFTFLEKCINHLCFYKIKINKWPCKKSISFVLGVQGPCIGPWTKVICALIIKMSWVVLLCVVIVAVAALFFFRGSLLVCRNIAYLQMLIFVSVNSFIIFIPNSILAFKYVYDIHESEKKCTSFLIWVPNVFWLELPMPCWIEVVNMSNSVLSKVS